MFIRWVLEHFQTNFSYFLIKIICLINQGFLDSWKTLKITRQNSLSYYFLQILGNPY